MFRALDNFVFSSYIGQVQVIKQNQGFVTKEKWANVCWYITNYTYYGPVSSKRVF